MAGASVAYSLAKRDKRVLVLEKEDSIAANASNNSSAILSPYLTNKDSSLARVYAEGFSYSSALLETVDRASSYKISKKIGAIQFPSTPRMKKIFQRSDREQLSEDTLKEIFGLTVSPPAFQIPETRVVDMPKLVEVLLTRPNIEVRTSTEILAIMRDKNGWTLQGKTGPLVRDVPHVIACSAHEARRFSQLAKVPLEPVRGEIWKLRKKDLNIDPQKVLLFGGYLTPSSEGIFALGGSFKHSDFSLSSNLDELKKLVRQASSFIPELFRKQDFHDICSWIGFRTSTHDRLPYIGLLPDFDSISKEASQYRSGSNIKKLIPQTFLPGLWVSLGHGSRGLTTCPIAGEIITRLINQEELGEYHSISKEISVSRLC